MERFYVRRYTAADKRDDVHIVNGKNFDTVIARFFGPYAEKFDWGTSIIGNERTRIDIVCDNLFVGYVRYSEMVDYILEEKVERYGKTPYSRMIPGTLDIGFRPTDCGMKECFGGWTNGRNVTIHLEEDYSVVGRTQKTENGAWEIVWDTPTVEEGVAE